MDEKVLSNGTDEETISNDANSGTTSHKVNSECYKDHPDYLAPQMMQQATEM